jgi:GntR family transcriptional regulator
MTRSDLVVDRESDVPLGTQLAWRLRALIATGGLAPGERLPGVRELAESAGINVNTARAVYARLEEQGLLRSEHGRGTFVDPRAAEHGDLARVAADAAAAARAAGLDPRDLATALYSGADLPSRVSDAPASGSPEDEVVDDPAVRRVLRAQIADLEEQLVRRERGAELRETRPSAGRLLSAAELRDVRDALAQRLARVRDQRAEERRRVYAERAAALSPTAPPRTWRHAGVWTGKARPGVVWTGR